MNRKELDRHWQEEFDRLSREKIKDYKPSPFRMIAVVVAAVFLLAICLVYLTTNPTVRSIIAGLIESSTVEEGFAVDIGSGNRLFFVNSTYSRLLEIYDGNPELEFKVCLMGEVTGSDYFIYEVYEPTMVFQSHNQVIASPCPASALVSMHSHPFRHCLPSQQDFISFEAFKKSNPSALMAVMCERGRFNFYR